MSTATVVEVNQLQVALARDAAFAKLAPEEQHCLNVDLREAEFARVELGERHYVHRIVQGVVDREPDFAWYVATERGDLR